MQIKTHTWTEVKPNGEPLPDWVLNKVETSLDHLKLQNQIWTAQDDLRIFHTSYTSYILD